MPGEIRWPKGVDANPLSPAKTPFTSSLIDTENDALPRMETSISSSAVTVPVVAFFHLHLGLAGLRVSVSRNCRSPGR